MKFIHHEWNNLIGQFERAIVQVVLYIGNQAEKPNNIGKYISFAYRAIFARQ